MKTRYSLAKISNFAKVKGGKRLPKTHNFASGVTPYLYIKARDIGNGRINITEPSFLYEKTFNLLKNYIVKKNDVCITIVGANIGDIGIIPEHLDGANLTENAAKVTELDGVNPLFLKYALMTDTLQSMMKQVAAGSAQAKLGIYKIEALTIPKPPLTIQDKIANILSKYDDLIENNRRRIELLEESARSLYWEWFVYLRFPGHEHTPIIDSIPEGWEKIPLGETLTLQRGFDLPVSQRIPGKYPIYASTGINGYHEKPKVKSPGVVTGRSGSLGTVMYVAEDFWPLNTTLWVKNFKKVDAVFALHLLQTLNLEQYNGGAAVPTLNRNDVHRIEILCPPNKLKSLFYDFANPVYAQIQKLEIYNLQLQQARELLLPRLMNGEIAV